MITTRPRSRKRAQTRIFALRNPGISLYATHRRGDCADQMENSKMKTALTLAAVASLGLLAACGEKAAETTTTTTTTETAAPADAMATTEAAPAADPMAAPAADPMAAPADGAAPAADAMAAPADATATETK
jgi:hypothetical protein